MSREADAGPRGEPLRTAADNERLREVILDLERSKERVRQAQLESESLLGGLRALSDARDAESVLRMTLEALKGPLEFENAFILLEERGADSARPLAVASSTTALFEGARFLPRDLFRAVMTGRVAITIDPEVVPEWADQPQELRAAASSALYLPLIGNRRRGLAVAVHSRRNHFAKPHEAIARRFAPLAMQALRNVEHFEQTLTVLRQEVEIARRIQSSILPRSLAVPGYDLCAEMSPASEVGGDYYDIIPAPDGCWLGIGDVSGHGLTAGLVALMVQSGVATAVRGAATTSMEDLIAAVNCMLVENIRKRIGGSDHITFALVRCHSDGRIEAAGEHEDILIVPASGGPCRVIETEGMWLGIREGITGVIRTVETRLEEGDVLVLFTDGIVEARANREVFGHDRFRRALERARHAPLAEIKSAVFDELKRFCPEPEDDVTLLLARRSSHPADPQRL